MKDLILRAVDAIHQGQEVMIVTIFSAEGSTPGRVGATLLVGKSGYLSGTVGGGQIEYVSTEIAQNWIVSNENNDNIEGCSAFLKEFVLDNTQAGGLGMICGGKTELLFFSLGRKDLNILEEVVQEEGTFFLPICEEKLKIIEKKDHPQRIELDGCLGMALPLVRPGRVLLLGGGHVSEATGVLLGGLSYPYLVVDDREEFSNKERFPTAISCVISPYHQLKTALIGWDFTEKDGICIMTRGHLGDLEGMRFALSNSFGYIGVMGSRAKKEKVFFQLEQEGFASCRKRVTTPIGLPICGVTPDEIAISIVGQLILWKNGGEIPVG